MHLAKRRLELLPHNQPVFLGHQLRPNSLRLVRYSGVLLLAHLRPLQPNLLRALLELLGNNNLPRAQMPARPLAQVLRLRSLNNNKPLHLVPLVSLNSHRLQGPVLVSLVVQVHLGSQSLLQDLQTPSVNQVSA